MQNGKTERKWRVTGQTSWGEAWHQKGFFFFSHWTTFQKWILVDTCFPDPSITLRSACPPRISPEENSHKPVSLLVDSCVLQHCSPFHPIGSGYLLVQDFADTQLVHFCHSYRIIKWSVSCITVSLRAEDGVGWEDYKEMARYLLRKNMRLDCMWSCDFEFCVFVYFVFIL